MQDFQTHFDSPQPPRRHRSEAALAVRFWLGWLLLVLGLAFAIHAYFEYRNHELDKRLENVRIR